MAEQLVLSSGKKSSVLQDAAALGGLVWVGLQGRRGNHE